MAIRARSRVWKTGLSTAVLALCPVLAAAQLNETCTVSALNRTAPVRPDGVWVLPNVPANQGPVRVRATCVENGVTRSGQSAFITIPRNGTIEVTDILFGDPTPIPLSLQLFAPSTTLHAAGETSQVAAIAAFSDGSTADLTAVEGTDFRSSSPAIASIDADGLVTAHASGRALVSANHEGALGVLVFQVVAAGDTDGDGMPDDFEVAFSLDPNNPADALGDPDRDGLTSLQEFQAGLNPVNPDTDGDRLRDGDEAGYGTNPLLFDTDGDRVSDGLEILAGSDPLDPDSVDLGPIIASLAVSPSAFTIVFNTAVGEASRRLDVTARLIDGTEIPARSRRYGTNYESSSLAVASFGAEDGVVFAGQSGTATVTVRIGTASATAGVTVETFSPTALAYLPLPGFPNGVAVQGDHAYVASGGAGLHVVDVSSLEAPVRVGTVDTPGNANDVRVKGSYAYVADGARGLQIVDVSNPAQPRIVGSVDTPGDATDLAVLGDRVYVADGPAGLVVVDVTNRTAPVLLGRVDTPGVARGVDAVDDFAVVADSWGGVHVVNAADPSNPVIVGSVGTRPFGSRAADVAVRGRLAWVADGAGSLGGLRVVDFEDPETPVVVGRTSDAFGLVSVALDGGYALTADYYFVNAVPVFDASVPAYTAVLDFSSLSDHNGNGVAVRPDGAVFLVAVAGYITDNGTNSYGYGGLYAGRYRLGGDDLGVAPEVSITAPAAGASARERTRITLRAQASDDIHVESVRFLVDGVEVFRDFKRPYETTVPLPVGTPSIRIGAVAVDMAGNESTAEEVAFTVIPDDKPSVTLRAPVEGLSVREGTWVELIATAKDDVAVASLELFAGGVLQASCNWTPCFASFFAGTGGTQVTVAAVATDNVGQSTSITRVVTVEDDTPPLVSLLAPGEGAQVIEGSRLLVTVGATDDVEVTVVRLAADGAEVGTDDSAPYRFTVAVPEGATELRLTATAEDGLGQQSTVERVMAVGPDPLTTALGRVVDAQGQPVAGAAVACQDRTGTSGTDGSFSVSGLATLRGRIACGASAPEPGGGGTRSGGSPPVPPVPGGATEVGDIVLQGRLLYLGVGSLGQAGGLLVLDEPANRPVAWSRPFQPYGLSGLAFDGEGALFATVLSFDGGGEQAAAAGKTGKAVRLGNAAAFQEDGGTLLRLDPDTGAVVDRFGPFIVDGWFNPGLMDLAIDPASGLFYAFGSADYFERTIYQLDLDSLEARVVATGLPFDAKGLAFGPDGLLAVLVNGYGGAELWSVDPDTGAVVAIDPVAGSVAWDIGGMVRRPGTNTFLVGSTQEEAPLYELDLGTLELHELPAFSGPVGGGLQGLAYRPVAGAATVTTIQGITVDGDGLLVEGAEVVTLGASGTTGADGRFTLTDVRVPTDVVRVAARFGGETVMSSPVPPVTGGLTDVGTLVFGAAACVKGILVAPYCQNEPVTSPLDLFLQDDETGQSSLVGQVTPDASGSFCVMLRRYRSYFLRREDFTCTCGGPATCETSLFLDDPDAVGDCGGDQSGCQDLGYVNLSCDYFCGGS